MTTAVTPLSGNSVQKIDFDASKHPSCGPSCIRPWMVREVALAALAVFVIALSGWALHNVNTLSNFVHLNMASIPLWAYKCFLAAGSVLAFRTLIWRPLVMIAIHCGGKKALYPIEKREKTIVTGNGFHLNIETKPIPLDPSWLKPPPDVRPFSLKTQDGNLIAGHWLDRMDTEKQNRKGVVVLCLGNVALYDATTLYDTDYEFIRKEGYDLVLYHPPGYGSSEGCRTPESDFYALEAVILFITNNRSIPSFDIHLQCFSLGGSVGGAISAELPLGSIKFVVPMARTEDVLERVSISYSPWLGRIVSFCLGGVVRDLLGYDNVEALAHAKVNSIEIIEGESDNLMTTGTLEPEAVKMTKAWLKVFAPLQTIQPLGPRWIGKKFQEYYDRVKVQTADRHFVFRTMVSRDHNLIPFPLPV